MSLIYQVRINGVLVHDSKTNPTVYKGVFKEIVNKAGSFDFSFMNSIGITPKLYDIVVLSKNYKVIYGGIITSVGNTNGLCDVKTEGCLSYFDGCFDVGMYINEYITKGHFKGTITDHITRLNGTYTGPKYNINDNNCDIVNIMGVDNTFPKNVRINVLVPVGNGDYKKICVRYENGAPQDKITDEMFDKIPMVTSSGTRAYVKAYKTLKSSDVDSEDMLLPIVYLSGGNDGDIIDVNFAPFAITKYKEDEIVAQSSKGTGEFICSGTTETFDNVYEKKYKEISIEKRLYLRSDISTSHQLEVGKYYQLDFDYNRNYEYILNITDENKNKEYSPMFYSESLLKSLMSCTVDVFGGYLTANFTIHQENYHPTITFCDSDSMPMSNQTLRADSNILSSNISASISVANMFCGLSVNNVLYDPVYHKGMSNRKVIKNPKKLRFAGKDKRVNFNVNGKTNEEMSDEILKVLEEIENSTAPNITINAVDLSYIDSSLNQHDIGVKTTAEIDGEEYDVVCIQRTINITEPEKDVFVFSNNMNGTGKISSGGSSSATESKNKRTSDESDTDFNTIAISGTGVTTHSSDPLRYCRKGDIVYLQGKLSATSSFDGGSVTYIGTMPAGYIPKSTRYLMMACSGARIARCGVSAAGKIFIDFVRLLSNGTAHTGELGFIDFTFSYSVS